MEKQSSGDLRTEALSIGYTHARRHHEVAKELNLTLRAGELTCLIGPNGVGKSTLMRTLAGMHAPLSGTVMLGDSHLHRLPPSVLATKLAVVLTDRVEVGNLSVYALVALGRHPYTDWRGRLSPDDDEIVTQAIEQVGALTLAHRPVNELSDGERQRVMIARALAQLSPPRFNPSLDQGEGGKVLMLDEPTAFLDLPRRVEILQLLSRVAHTTRCAILLSTHDLDLALRIADRLWLMASDGQLVEGLPEELVLNGSLAQSFRSEGIDFDMAAGSFKVQRHPCGPIALFASGDKRDEVNFTWTGRALERVGFEVMIADKSQAYQVHVNGGWKVVTPTDSHHFSRLHEMIDFVKHG